MNWHHEHLCEKLDAFARGEIKRLMVFMPPQHGKSELVSRRLPAFIFGRDKDKKYIGASYSSDLASGFNKSVQRIMADDTYVDIFGETRLSEGAKVSQGGYSRNTEMFEIVGGQGFYKAVGVGGSMTGSPADIISIDDPIKDAQEAYSIRIRDNIWNWFTDVVETRLSNSGQILLTMTRWHEDDLAGRLLDPKNQLDDEDKWEVVSFPAIKEDNLNPDDPREIGEALWESKHSKRKILKTKAKSVRTFTSLYQQKPAPEEGYYIKKEWFKFFRHGDLPKNVVKNYYTDGAYGKENSDNTATLCYSVHENKLYIWNAWPANLTFPDFIKAYKDFLYSTGYSNASRCYFEPKAIGISSVQQLKTETLEDGRIINVMEDKSPVDSKFTRVMASTATIEGGSVYLLANQAWNDGFISECCVYPNGTKDDQVDSLAAIIAMNFLNKRKELKISFA